jgi:hypothetical protein
MFRKALISLVAAAALGAGIIAMTSAAEARHHHRHGNAFIGLGFFPFFGGGYPAYGFGYPAYGNRYPLYYNDYNDYNDCGYQWVAVKKWNKSHSHRIVVHRKRWVCY